MSMWYLAAMAASSALKGLSAASAQSAQNRALLQNANYRSAVLQYNADQNYNAALYNSATIGSTARLDALRTITATTLNIRQLKEAADFNMSIQKAATEMNLALLSDQLPQLLDQYNLDTAYLQQNAARQEGTIIASQAASGTVISSGSNALTLMDHQTQTQLAQSVLDLNLHTAQKSVFDAMAKSQWEGQMQIDAIAFSANQQLYAMKSSAAFDISSSLYNAFSKQQQTLFNAYSQRQSAYYDASTLLTSAHAQTSSPTYAGVIAGTGKALDFATMYYTGKK